MIIFVVFIQGHFPELVVHQFAFESWLKFTISAVASVVSLRV